MQTVNVLRPLKAVFHGTVPLTLYRVTRTVAIKLRPFQGKTGASFDLKLGEDGLAHPLELSNGNFIGPNGMSLRPLGIALSSFIRASPRTVVITEIPAGTPLPAFFNLVHEHSDHYSLQTAEVIELATLNTRLTEFMGSFPRISRDNFLSAHPDDVGGEIYS